MVNIDTKAPKPVIFIIKFDPLHTFQNVNFWHIICTCPYKHNEDIQYLNDFHL